MYFLVDRVRHPVRGYGVLNERHVEGIRGANHAVEQFAGIRQHDRFCADSPNNGAANRAFGIMQKGADRMCKFARLTADLVIAPARAPRLARNFDCSEEFTRGQHSFKHASDELFNGDAALTPPALNNRRRAERRQRRNPICRRVSMHQAAADGATIAHSAIGDAGGDLAYCAIRYVRHAAVLNVGVRDAASEEYRIRGLFDTLKLGDRGNINDDIRLDQPQIEHRPKRLSASEKLYRHVFTPAEREGSGKIGRTLVREWNRFHAALRLPRSIASNTRRGVIGEIRSSARNGRSASLTAFAIAAGGAIAPPSPIPLTPNSVYGASVSM